MFRFYMVICILRRVLDSYAKFSPDRSKDLGVIENIQTDRYSRQIFYFICIDFLEIVSLSVYVASRGFF